MRFLASATLELLADRGVAPARWYTWTSKETLVVTQPAPSWHRSDYPGPQAAAASFALSVHSPPSSIEPPACHEPVTTSSAVSAQHLVAVPDAYRSTAQDPESVDPSRFSIERDDGENAFGCQYPAP